MICSACMYWIKFQVIWNWTYFSEFLTRLAWILIISPNSKNSLQIESQSKFSKLSPNLKSVWFLRIDLSSRKLTQINKPTITLEVCWIIDLVYPIALLKEGSTVEKNGLTRTPIERRVLEQFGPIETPRGNMTIGLTRTPVKATNSTYHNLKFYTVTDIWQLYQIGQ